MKKNYIKIIDQIQKIRSKNNVNWMNILKLVFKLDPDQASKIMKKINYDDKQISKLLNKLANDIKIMKFIPYGSQFIDKGDIDKLSVILSKDKITTGPVVKVFENKIKNYLNSRYSLVCNSGTSAIFLALQSIGIKKEIA